MRPNSSRVFQAVESEHKDDANNKKKQSIEGEREGGGSRYLLTSDERVWGFGG